MGFYQYHPKANRYIPLINTSKKWNSKSTREGMAGAKPRTPPSSAHQIYGKVPEKNMNPNCSFYHAQSKEMDSQYAENICTVKASGMDYIWMHGAAYIQMPDPVVSKRKMNN